MSEGDKGSAVQTTELRRRSEADAYYKILQTISRFPITDPSNMDAVNMRLIAEGAIECGAESNRHSGAVGAEKRAEQSDPGGGHEVTEHDVKKPYEQKPSGMIPRPDGVAQASWMPIETAPKDGNTVIVWDDPVMGEAYYDVGEKSWWWANTGPGDYTAEAIYPTLWQSMPAPPSPVPSAHREAGK